MRPLIGLMSGINRALTNAGVFLACFFLVMMTVAVILQVVSREMRAPIGWTEEIALASMVWVAFLVGPWAYRHHQFTRIDVVLEALSLPRQALFNIFIHLFEAALMIGAIYYSWHFFIGGNSMLPQTTGLARAVAEPLLGSEAAQAVVIKNKYVYLILPLGFAGLLLVSIEHFFRAIETLRTGRDRAVGYELRGVAHPAESPEVMQRQTDDDPDRTWS